MFRCQGDKTVHAKIFYLIHDNWYFFLSSFINSLLSLYACILHEFLRQTCLLLSDCQSRMGVCYCTTFVINVRQLLLSDTCYWPTIATVRHKLLADNCYCPTLVTSRHWLLSDTCYWSTFLITVRHLKPAEICYLSSKYMCY